MMNTLLKTGKIQAISFDGDMTLWDFDKVMRHSLSQTLSELRHRLPNAATDQLTIEDMIVLRNEVAESLRGKVTNLEEIRLQSFIYTLQKVGSTDLELAADLNKIYLKHRFENIELYDDVQPTLRFLSHHLPCGLISNGNSYPERCGFSGLFSFVVFSQDVGVEKPNPAIFYHALKQLRCLPQQLIHVGDSLESDVGGAKAVGAISIWLNRYNQQNTSTIVPDFEIRTLKELPEIMSGSVLNR
jgi:FMN hydrolase / 5-amino-6-(5-phospho-D-ribitylamino)uracil phosphatase